MEIRKALQDSGLPDPVRLLARVRPAGRFPQPDVIAWHPTSNIWHFHEIKRGNDRIDPDQLRTLALLRHVYGADVAVIRYIEAGRRSQWPHTATAPPLEFNGNAATLALIGTGRGLSNA